MTELILHGHFYQPPRENPWTGLVEREPKVKPHHDWNERIYSECYRTNAFARILDGYGRIEQIVNNFERISFNVGPTLFSWLEAHDPVTYARILEADRASAARMGGHGNAIAQAYGHAILPLLDERDRSTQVRWGLSDFEHRFGRRAAALWIPETACDDATLGTLIDHGLSYAILAPHQAARVRRLGEDAWTDVAPGEIDPGIAYRYFHRDGSGRSITLFFYDGPIARAIAFEGLLVSSQRLVARLLGGRGGPGRIAHAATDGETYGHHFRLGELTLAHATAVEAAAQGASFTNYAAYLAAHPPVMEVEIQRGPDGRGTSWSCAHGVGRWCRDCGCSTAAKEGWNQAWRAPLRQALELLRKEAAGAFEERAAALLGDPWAARDRYVELLLRGGPSRDEWLARNQRRPLDADEKVRALSLLELQRSALLMFTSCGWFFADVSGVETVQILSYAGRALDWMEELGIPSPRARFLEILAEARSNVAGVGTGADVFTRSVEPLRVAPSRVACHLAISGLVDDGDDEGAAGGYLFERTRRDKERQGRLRLATSRLELEHAATGRRHDFAAGALHLGGVDFCCAARPYPGEAEFAEAARRVLGSFRSASLPVMLRILSQELGPDEGALESLLPDGRERVSELVLGGVVTTFVDEYSRLYEAHQRVLEQLQEAGFELPRELHAAAELALGRRFEEAIASAERSLSPAAYERAAEIADEALRRGYEIDLSVASRLFGDMITEVVGRLMGSPSTERLRSAVELVRLSRRLHADGYLFRAQELLYDGGRGRLPEVSAGMSELAIALGFAPKVAGRNDASVMPPASGRAPSPASAQAR